MAISGELVREGARAIPLRVGDTEMPKSLRHVRELRQRSDMTQREAAEMAGNQSHWSKIELGKDNPSLETLLGVQRALQLRSIEDLFAPPPTR